MPPNEASSRRGRMSESDLPKVEGSKRHPRNNSVEVELAKERAQAEGDLDVLLGRLIARATQAEQRVSQLEKTLAKLNEERTVQDARMAELRRQVEDLEKASWEPPTAGRGRRSGESRDHAASILALRTLVGDMMRQIDRLANGRATLPSDPPTPRVRNSDAPRTTRSEAPSSRR